jgi:large subunit ribosomal protein L21
MYAIVNADGRQRRIARGEVIWIEKQDIAVGEKLTFNNVLLLNDDETVRVGTPTVEGASVVAEVLSQGRDRKIVVYKFKRRKGYSCKNGHRQSYTEARILDILMDGTPLIAKEASAETEAVEETPVEAVASGTQAPETATVEAEVEAEAVETPEAEAEPEAPAEDAETTDDTTQED